MKVGDPVEFIIPATFMRIAHNYSKCTTIKIKVILPDPNDWVISYVGKYDSDAISLFSQFAWNKKAFLCGENQGVRSDFGIIDVKRSDIRVRTIFKPATPDVKKQKNDGEHCIYCLRKTKELVLFTGKTRYCPDCETPTQKDSVKPKTSVDSTYDDLLRSIDDLLSDDPVV